MVNFAQGHVHGWHLPWSYDRQQIFAAAVPLLLVVIVVAFLSESCSNALSFASLSQSRRLHRRLHRTRHCAHEYGQLFFPERHHSEGVRRADLKFGDAQFQEAYLWVIGCTIILVASCIFLRLYPQWPHCAPWPRTRKLQAPSASTCDGDRADFGLSFAVAAVAGVLIGPLYFVSFDMGTCRLKRLAPRCSRN